LRVCYRRSVQDERRPQRLTPERVTAALKRTASVGEAAEVLGVHRVSLYRYMRMQGIRIEQDRRIVSPSGEAA
jgi:hypothetical protein